MHIQNLCTHTNVFVLKDILVSYDFKVSARKLKYQNNLTEKIHCIATSLRKMH